MAFTYEPIAQTTASGQSTITFSSVPSTYTDLILVINGSSSGSLIKKINFNGDTGSNYQCNVLYFSSPSNFGSQKYQVGWLDVINAGADRYQTIVHINNYSNSSARKTYMSRQDCRPSSTELTIGTWNNTNAITQIDIIASANNFQNTKFSLYGIAAA